MTAVAGSQGRYAQAQQRDHRAAGDRVVGAFERQHTRQLTLAEGLRLMVETAGVVIGQKSRDFDSGHCVGLLVNIERASRQAYEYEANPEDDRTKDRHDDANLEQVFEAEIPIGVWQNE